MTLFGYFPGKGWLYRIHPAVKLVFMATAAMVVALLPWSAALVFFWILSVFFITSELPARLIIPLLKFLLFMVLILTAMSDFRRDEFFSSLLGQLGLWVKLADYTFLGLLFSTVTSAAEIRGVFYRFFKPFRFLPRQEIVLVFTFVFSLLPIIFSLYARVQTALQLRGMGRMRNPLLKVMKSLVPFLSLCFTRMDDMAEIYSVRCPGGNFVPESPRTGPGEKVVIFLMIIISASVVFLIIARKLDLMARTLDFSL